MKKFGNKRNRESIDAQHVDSEDPLKLVRQKRYSPNDKSCYIQHNKFKLRVVNYSPFGLAVECDENISLDKELFDVAFVYENVEVTLLHLRQIRRELTEEGKSIIAFETIGEPISLNKLDAVSVAQRVIKLQQNYATDSDHIPAEIKSKVYDITDWLENLMEEMSRLENKKKHIDNQSLNDFEDAFVVVVAKYLGQVFPQIYLPFSQIIESQSDELRRQSIEFIRHKLNHIIYQSPLNERVYTKTLSNTVDGEMMSLFYQNENARKSLFARCLQRYYLDVPTARAVTSRSDYLVNVILNTLQQNSTDNAFRVLSVACGDAMEWQQLLTILHEEDTQKVIVDLLDQDEEVLLATENHLNNIATKYPSTVNFNFERKAIKNIVAISTEFKEYDLIYSAGLFDYLSDPMAFMAASRLFNSLKPGGKLIVGNFNVDNPQGVGMGFALDWKLIYRSENDLLELFRNVGGEMYIEKEQSDINLFCTIRKPS